MDNKKLMHILLRDVRELESFVEELKDPVDFDEMDRELLLTRIAGIRHLLEVAAGHAEHPAETQSVPLRHYIVKERAAEKEAVPEAVTEPVKEEGKKVEMDAGENPETLPVEKESFPSAAPPVISPVAAEITIAGEMQLEEEMVQSQEKQILAEKFTAGKSVNDLLLEKGKSDSRFTNLPVSNLGNAITTNDKFLFIRELFEGNTDDYSETIRKIDSMSGIQEAAAYLRENFKWKKNETSLKFIDLVRRRFMH